MVYKYSELQVSVVTQKLNFKASYKIPFFIVISVRFQLVNIDQNWVWFKIINRNKKNNVIE